MSCVTRLVTLDDVSGFHAISAAAASIDVHVVAQARKK
jgi:hypothetical protein